jgi:transcriptional antiterminator RfaH
LFARFNWKASLTRVHYAPAVSGVVHFGSRWPIVPDVVIEEIRAMLGPDEVHVISKEYTPGDRVEIAGGLFHGLEAVITQVMPGRQRVAVLMEFLGRQTTVEVGMTSIVKHGIRR